MSSSKEADFELQDERARTFVGDAAEELTRRRPERDDRPSAQGDDGLYLSQ
jgi:hypothetical protein